MVTAKKLSKILPLGGLGGLAWLLLLMTFITMSLSAKDIKTVVVTTRDKRTQSDCNDNLRRRQKQRGGYHQVI